MLIKYTSPASAAKKLSLLHLANDILQNSRRKGPEYIREFGKVMPEAMSQSLK